MAIDPRDLDIVRKLGAGALGHTCAALLDGQLVVLKLANASGIDREWARARFDRELEVSRQVEHPGVVDVLAAVEVPGGPPALIEEYVSGHGLDEVLQRAAPMPASSVAELVAPIADALDAFHAAGWIHRDLRADEVMVTRAGDGLRPAVRIMNLGRACRFDASDLSSGRLSPATDIYLLGLICFRALTGQRPAVDPRTAMGLAGESAPDVLQVAPSASTAAAGLVAAMLDPAVELRPSAAEVASAWRRLPECMPMDPLDDELPVLSVDVDPFVAERPTPAFCTDRLVARMVRDAREVTRVRQVAPDGTSESDRLFGPLD